MLSAIFAYPGLPQFLLYAGWKRGRTTFRDKTAFQSTPFLQCNVLTLPASEQRENYVQQVLFILLNRRKHRLSMRPVYLLKKKKNQLSTVRCIKKKKNKKKNQQKVGQLQRVDLFRSGSWTVLQLPHNLTYCSPQVGPRRPDLNKNLSDAPRLASIHSGR